MKHPLLKVENLSVSFGSKNHGSETGLNRVLSGLSFELYQGETLALVGESGSGKSITALSILQLLPYPYASHPSGSIRYKGQELLGAKTKVLQRIRGNDISIIFQEPMTALNPLHVIEKQITESLILHQKLTGEEARRETIQLLQQVGITNTQSRLADYPHQLSGGQRQRVMIAMALANKPSVLLADEPTTALDVTVQAKILQLLKEIQITENLGIVLISHDLNLVKKIADRVLVLRQGALVEQGTTKQIFTYAQQSYTQTLLAAEPPDKPATKSINKPILQAKNIRVWFPVKRGFLRRTVSHIKAVDDISVQLNFGQTLGIVGESGSGKTTLALALLNLIPYQGQIVLADKVIQGEDAVKALRTMMQMVFQDPYGSLSPRLSVSEIVSEGLQVHQPELTKEACDHKVIQILQQVEIEPDMRFRYPHEFSGGQRQRIAIARALILNPNILVLDEPTSALDRTVQVQILSLLNALQQTHNLSYVFISHDLSVVKAIADQVIVMKEGKIVEQGKVEKIFNAPCNSYTRELISASNLNA